MSRYKDIKNVEELLTFQYGEVGTPTRDAFTTTTDLFYWGQMLREERLKRSLTQKELAKRTNLKASYISRIENGKTDVQLSTYIRLLRGLGATLSIS